RQTYWPYLSLLCFSVIIIDNGGCNMDDSDYLRCRIWKLLCMFTTFGLQSYTKGMKYTKKMMKSESGF
ncbi:MAG: hypothetical protein ACI4V5_01515, partial [Prevotella sp.]